MLNKRQKKGEILEEVPTAKLGDRVFRLRRKPRGMLHSISAKASRLLKGKASK